MKLEVVIVSFNTASLLKDCLNSLIVNLKKEDLLKDTQITVVDNASKDKSVSMVKKSFSKVKIIQNKTNSGFAAANNQALKVSKAKYIFLLNSDTIVRPKAISKLLNELEQDNSLWAVGPKLLNKDGTLQQSFGFAPTIFKVFCWMLFIDDLPFLSKIIHPYHASGSEWYKENAEADWVSGAALLFRRSVLAKTGLLDEKIFMYGEEVEWCYRLRKKGGKILYFNNAEITHFGGGSQKGQGASIIREFDSIIYFYKKHEPKSLIAARLLLKIGALLRLILFGIIQGSISKTRLYAKAFKVA